MDADSPLFTGSARPRVQLVAVVWGRDHVHRFLSYALPSLISCLEHTKFYLEHTCVFAVYTRPEDVQGIKSANIVGQLESLLTVEVRSLSFIVTNQKHWSVSSAHALASNRALEDDAYVVFLKPDAVYAVELFDSITKAIHNCRLALFVLGFRCSYESVGPVLDSIKTGQGGGLRMRSREAVGIAFDHMHREEKKLFWNSGEATTDLPHLYFGVAGKTVYAACWHLHPILVRPSKRVRAAGTIESGSYLRRVLKDLDRIEVITDSDQGFYIEVSREIGEPKQVRGGPISFGASVSWAMRNAHLLHRCLFTQVISVHATDIIQDGTVSSPQFVFEFVSEVARDYDYRRSRRAARWLRGDTSFRGLVARILSLVRAAYHAVSRLIYRILVRIFRPLATYALRSTGLMRAVASTIERSGFARWLLNAFLHVAAGGAGREKSTPEEDTLIGRFLFARGMALLDEGKLDDALALIRASNLLSRHEERGFYQSMCSVLIDLKKDAEDRARHILGQRAMNGLDPLVFAVVVWGRDYVESFLNFTLRTLLAPENIPALEGRHILFSIVTDEKSRPLFDGNKILDELNKHATIEFFVFPTDLTNVGHYATPNFNFYRLYGALDHTSIHFARALKAHIFFVVADGLFASGSIPAILRYLERGYDVCVNASLVAKKEALLPVLEHKIRPDGSINISSWDLANLCFRYRHDYCSQRLMTGSNTNFDKYPRELYFPDREGLVVHALYQHPWAISSTALSRNVEFDYHIVDFRLISRIFAGSFSFEKLKVIEDSSEVFIANFAPEARRFDTTGKPFSIGDFVSAHLHSKPIHWHIWKHRQLIRCDTALQPEKNSELIATNILNFLRRAIEV